MVPSTWWENSPLVIQEAFKFRRPVICSDIGGMAEKVTDGVNGLHFRAGNALDLADRIEEAVESPGLWDQLRSEIEPPATIAETVDRLLATYERCGPIHGASGRTHGSWTRAIASASAEDKLTYRIAYKRCHGRRGRQPTFPSRDRSRCRSSLRSACCGSRAGRWAATLPSRPLRRARSSASRRAGHRPAERGRGAARCRRFGQADNCRFAVELPLDELTAGELEWTLWTVDQAGETRHFGTVLLEPERLGGRPVFVRRRRALRHDGGRQRGAPRGRAAGVRRVPHAAASGGADRSGQHLLRQPEPVGRSAPGGGAAFPREPRGVAGAHGDGDALGLRQPAPGARSSTRRPGPRCSNLCT